MLETFLKLRWRVDESVGRAEDSATYLQFRLVGNRCLRWVQLRTTALRHPRLELSIFDHTLASRGVENIQKTGFFDKTVRTFRKSVRTFSKSTHGFQKTTTA